MNRVFHFFLSATILLSLSHCSTNIQYLGTERPFPTRGDVDLFFAEADIDRPFQVIGNMYYQDQPNQVIFDDVQDQMIRKARQVGAEAILFDQIGEQPEGDCDNLIFRARAIIYEE